MARGDLVLVLGDDREPFHGFELRHIGQTLGLGHLVERLPQTRGPPLDDLFELRLGALERVQRVLHLQQRRRTDAELRLVDRLGDEVVGAGFDRKQAILPRRLRGDHDHRHIVTVGIPADAAAHFETVHGRHHHVEQHEVDVQAQFGESLDAVARRLGLVSERTHQRRGDPPGHFVVVDDEDAPAPSVCRVHHANDLLSELLWTGEPVDGHGPLNRSKARIELRNRGPCIVRTTRRARFVPERCNCAPLTRPRSSTRCPAWCARHETRFHRPRRRLTVGVLSVDLTCPAGRSRSRRPRGRGPLCFEPAQVFQHFSGIVRRHDRRRRDGVRLHGSVRPARTRPASAERHDARQNQNE